MESVRKQMGRSIRLLVSGAVAAAALWCAPVRADDAPAADGAALQQLSQASQTVYKRISGAILRVRMDVPPALLLTAAQRKEFEAWRLTQQGNGVHKHDGDAAPASRPANALGGGPNAMFRAWLDQKLKDPATDAATLDKLHAVAARMAAAPMGEMMGVVIDDKGDMLVIGSQLSGSSADSVRVVNVDGVETGGKIWGVHRNRGFALVRLDNPGSLGVVPVAAGSPAGGELLLAMTARQGSLEWIIAPGHFARKGMPERFAVAGGDGPTFLFNVKGELAAIGFNQFALPMDAYKSDMEWIATNGKDIQQRQLGLKYVPVPPDVRKNSRALYGQTAVIVSDVEAGSLAEKAGLQKNDIVIRIDKHPISQMKDIQMDMATQTGSVPVEILRNDKEMTVELPPP